MNTACTQCGAHLDSPWKFCPLCGAAQARPEETPLPHEHERTSAQYGFIGLMFGLFVATPLILYGSVMCLLGPPMVFGIPLILIGIAAPLVGPYLAVNAVRGKCPWCGEKITSIGPLDAFYCHRCSHRIAVKDHEMMRA
jgi:DNA-directed RNA polymerase subunit RPC12/RpoP